MAEGVGWVIGREPRVDKRLRSAWMRARDGRERAKSEARVERTVEESTVWSEEVRGDIAVRVGAMWNSRVVPLAFGKLAPEVAFSWAAVTARNLFSPVRGSVPSYCALYPFTQKARTAADTLLTTWALEAGICEK